MRGPRALWADFCRLPRAFQWGVVSVLGVAVLAIAMVATGGEGGFGSGDGSEVVSGATSTTAPTTTSRPSAEGDGTTATVTEVLSGDLFATAQGTRVRLFGLAAPEEGGCLAEESTAQLRRLLPAGQAVRLVFGDQRKDPDGNDLALVFRATDGVLVNVAMVRDGFAVVRLDQPGLPGQEMVTAAARTAQAAERGVFGQCPELAATSGRPRVGSATTSTGPAVATTTAPTTRPSATGPAPSTSAPARPAPRPTLEVVPTEPGDRCSPGYRTFCIPPPPPDVDCEVMPFSNFPVEPPDPHGFDPDGDGVGCEA